MHPGHAQRRRLAGSVDGGVRSGDAPDDGPEVDDGAGPALPHRRRHRLRQEELAAQVDVDVAVPRLRGDVGRGDARAPARGARVVDQGINTATATATTGASRDGRFGALLEAREVRHVAVHERRGRGVRDPRHLVDQLLRRVRVVV